MAWESELVKSFEARLDALAHSAEHDHRSLARNGRRTARGHEKGLDVARVVGPGGVSRNSCAISRKAQGKEVDLVRRAVRTSRSTGASSRPCATRSCIWSRNCIDHGIETPEARKPKGKPPRGTITVDIAQQRRQPGRNARLGRWRRHRQRESRTAAQKLGVGLQSGGQAKRRSRATGARVPFGCVDQSDRHRHFGSRAGPGHRAGESGEAGRRNLGRDTARPGNDASGSSLR